MPHRHGRSPENPSPDLDDLLDWVDEQKAQDKTLPDIFDERFWTGKQKSIIREHYGEPIVRTQQGVTIQYVPKLKRVVIRKKNGQFKSKQGYGKFIKQVQRIQLEQVAKQRRLSGKERRKLKKERRRERKTK